MLDARSRPIISKIPKNPLPTAIVPPAGGLPRWVVIRPIVQPVQDLLSRDLLSKEPWIGILLAGETIANGEVSGGEICGGVES